MNPSRIDINPAWESAPFERLALEAPGTFQSGPIYRHMTKHDKSPVPKYRVTWPDGRVTFQHEVIFEEPLDERRDGK